jgi:hypothetical protein
LASSRVASSTRRHARCGRARITSCPGTIDGATGLSS